MKSPFQFWGGVTGYNADYPARIFRSETGLTIGRYIIDARMQRIRNRMASPSPSPDGAGRGGRFIRKKMTSANGLEMAILCPL